LRFLIENGADVNFRIKTVTGLDRITPLFCAVKDQDFESIRLLVNNHANVNATIKLSELGTYMYIASELTYHNFNQGRVGTEKASAFMVAVRKGNPEIIKYLLNNGVSISKHPNIVNLAIEENQIESVKILLKAGAEFERPKSKSMAYGVICMRRRKTNQILNLNTC
jgi:ankyrin repeat protein